MSKSCDGCGAPARSSESQCQFCGSSLPVQVPDPWVGPEGIPVLRYGWLPLEEVAVYEEGAEPRAAGAARPLRLAAMALSATTLVVGVALFW